jgi:hypothetical protein
MKKKPRRLPDPRRADNPAFNLLWPVMNRCLRDLSSGNTGKVMNKLESAYLKQLANTPRKEWTDLDWQNIKVLTRKKGDDFWKRVASSTTDLVNRRHKPLYYKEGASLFLLLNWYALRFPNPDNLPGLHAWHPRAVMDLLQRMKRKHEDIYLGSRVSCDGKKPFKWYGELRRELGLAPTLPYSVREMPKNAADFCVALANFQSVLRGERTGCHAVKQPR